MFECKFNMLLIRLSITMLMPNILVFCFKINDLDNNHIFAWRVFVGPYWNLECFITKIIFYVVCAAFGIAILTFFAELLFKKSEKVEVPVRNHEQIQNHYIDYEATEKTQAEQKRQRELTVAAKLAAKPVAVIVKTPEQIKLQEFGTP